MKVLLINKYHYLRGGSEAVYFNTAKLLEKHGHTVVHFALKSEKNYSSPTSEYFVDMPELKSQNFLSRLKHLPSFFYNSESARKLEKLIIEQKPDIAHLNLIFNGLSLSILPVLKKHNIPVVISMHDYRFLCRSSSFMMKKECENCNTKLLYNMVRYKCHDGSRAENLLLSFESIEKEFLIKHYEYIDKYIFISNYQQNIHKKKRTYYTNSNSVRLYNFVPEIETMIVDHEKGDYFLFFGRITEEKGVRTYIKAASMLPEQKFLVVGSGGIEEELKKEAPSNVSFLGFKKGQELYDIIRAASFVVVPSEWQEAMGLVVIESMALGKPVIGSRIGGIPELIVQGKNGYLFEQSNVNDLVNILERTLSIKEEDYKEMSKFARDFSESNFNSEIHYSKLLDIYTEAIDLKKGKNI